MSSEKEWKTVNKGKKAAPNGKVPLTRNDKKKLANSMPRMDPTLPLKETPTIYQRFMEEELKAEKKAERSGRKEEVEVVKGGNGGGLPRKKHKNLNLRDAIDGLNKDELDEILLKDVQLFPNNPEISLKDVATYINSQLPNPPNADPVLSNKPHNFPLSEASSSKETFLSSILLQSKSDGVILDCLDHCIDSLIIAVSKEQASMGYRLVIQIILTKKPHLITNRVQKYDQLLQRHSSRPLRNLLVMWCFAQAGYTSLNNGIKIWFRLMFSQINVKNVNLFVVEFLEKLFKLYPSIPQPSGPDNDSKELTVSKTDYFRLFSEAHSTQSTLSETLKDRLKKLHPTIKAVAWNENRAHLNNFFLGYLSRCVHDCSDEKKTQLLDCSIACLLKEPKSVDAWNKDISKYTSQSAMLLAHIMNSGYAARLVGSEGRRGNKGLCKLLPTLRALKEENRKDEKMLDDVNLCVECIETMKVKGQRSKLSVILIFLLLLTPLLLFAADVHHHGSVHKTRTMKWARESGMQDMAQEVIIRIRSKSAIASKWLADNCPASIKGHLSELPSLDLETVSNWGKYLRDLSFKLSKELSDQLPFLLDHLTKVAEFIIHLLLSLYHYLTSIGQSTLDFLSQRVFVGEWSPDKLQGHVIHVTMVVKDNVDHVFRNIKKSMDEYLHNDAKN